MRDFIIISYLINLSISDVPTYVSVYFCKESRLVLNAATYKNINALMFDNIIINIINTEVNSY